MFFLVFSRFFYFLTLSPPNGTLTGWFCRSITCHCALFRHLKKLKERTISDMVPHDDIQWLYDASTDPFPNYLIFWKPFPIILILWKRIGDRCRQRLSDSEEKAPLFQQTMPHSLAIVRRTLTIQKVILLFVILLFYCGRPDLIS